MIPLKQMTLFSRKDIQGLFRTAIPKFNSFYCKILKSPSDKNHSRTLLVISKKVGNAVTRNKIRRRIKHALHQLPIHQNPSDWVIIIKRSFRFLPFIEIKKILEKVLCHGQ